MSAVLDQRPQGIVAWAAQTYGVDTGKVMSVLKNTCFKTAEKEAEATDAEVAGLLVVARAHNLNPFLREIFAFRDRKGGIVPVVGLDGWSRVINDHKAMSGLTFSFDSEVGEPKWCECTIFRKDREHPTVIREFFSECKRDTGPWKSHPRRMLRHKALIQCARVAFSFSGIYDEDEAQRIAEAEIDITPEVQPERGAGAALKRALAPPQQEAAKPAETELVFEAGNLAERVREATAGFAQATDGETLKLYAESLPEDVRGHEDFARAFHKRLGELAEAATKPEEKKGGKKAGTPRLRKQYVERFDRCDADTLDVAYDETRGFVWGEEDEKLLAAAYEKRKEKLLKDL